MRTRTKGIPRSILLGALVGLMALTAACQARVDGQVFFDENANGDIDSGEGGVPYAKLIVTRDDETIAEHYADATGRFDIPIKAKSGYLCVETDLSYVESNFEYIMQSMGAVPGTQAMMVTPPKALSADSDDEDEGEIDDDVEYHDEEEESTEIIPAGPDGWVSQSRYCKTIKYKGLPDLSIPVSMSYEDSIAQMPKRLTIECYSGDNCTIRIPYPAGCTLGPLELPKELKLKDTTQPGISSYDATFNIVTFGDSSTAAQKAQSSGPTFSISGFNLAQLDLAVSDDIDVGTTEVSVKPTAECYGQDVEFEEIPIELIKEIDVVVHQNLLTPPPSGGKFDAGDTAKIRVIVENKGRSIVSDGYVTFTPPTGSVIQNTTGCNNYGTKMLCDITPIGEDEKFEKDITFYLPVLSVPGAEETVNCSASFDSNDMEAAVSAGDVSVIIVSTAT